MNLDNLKHAIDLAKLRGELIGLLEGVCMWDIPEELRFRLQKKIEELRKITD